MNPKETITKIRMLLASYETEPIHLGGVASIDLDDVVSIRELLVRLDKDIDKLEENIDELQEEVDEYEQDLSNISLKRFEESEIVDYLKNRGYHFFQKEKPTLYDLSKAEILTELYETYSLREIEDIIEIKKIWKPTN